VSATIGSSTLRPLLLKPGYRRGCGAHPRRLFRLSAAIPIGIASGYLKKIIRLQCSEVAVFRNVIDHGQKVIVQLQVVVHRISFAQRFRRT
jgi:hypothetical protein